MANRITNEYSPATVSPPGATLADILEERGITQSELAQRMGRPVKTINEIIKAKTTIVPETAIQLERTLGVPASFWLTREAQYREWLARKEDQEGLEGQIEWLGDLPLRDMIKWGWVEKSTSKAQQVATCLRFFGVSSVEAWREHHAGQRAAFRISANHTIAQGAVAAWLRKGEIEAAEIRCRPWNVRGLHDALEMLRALTPEPKPSVFLPKLRSILSEHGVALAVVRAPKGCPASGATRFINSERALMLLSFRYLRDDQFWFSVFHELGHLLLHGHRKAFIEGLGLSNAEEQEADTFAAQVIVPAKLASRLKTLGVSRAAICDFAREVGVSPGMIVGRLQHDHILPFSHLNNLKARYQWVDGE